MKAKELRALSPEDIIKKEGELKKEYFNLRMQNATGQAENPVKIRYLRRDIARLKTVIAESKGEK